MVVKEVGKGFKDNPEEHLQSQEKTSCRWLQNNIKVEPIPKHDEQKGEGRNGTPAMSRPCLPKLVRRQKRSIEKFCIAYRVVLAAPLGQLKRTRSLLRLPPERVVPTAPLARVAEKIVPLVQRKPRGRKQEDRKPNNFTYPLARVGWGNAAEFQKMMQQRPE